MPNIEYVAKNSELTPEQPTTTGGAVVPASDAIADVRAKARSVAKQQRAARWARIGIFTAVIVALVAALAFYIVREVEPALEPRSESVPAGAVDDGFEIALPVDDVVAEQDAEGASAPEGEGVPEPTPTTTGPVEPANIQVYLDYKSLASAQFQRANNTQLESWLRQGAATLTYHPVVLLTPAGDSPQYARRAANALACVATYSPEQVYKFNYELLVNQPQPDSDTNAPTNEELYTLAVAVGARDIEQLEPCINEREFDKWVSSASTRAIEGPLAGIEGTKLDRVPMIFVNGKQYTGSLEDPVAFAQFVLGSVSTQYFDEPTPEPTEAATPTPTPSAAPTGEAEPPAETDK